MPADEKQKLIENPGSPVSNYGNRDEVSDNASESTMKTPSDESLCNPSEEVEDTSSIGEIDNEAFIEEEAKVMWLN